MHKRLSLIFSLVTVVSSALQAQTLRIKLVDGRNGQPIRNTYINVWVGYQKKAAVPVSIGSNGTGTLTLVEPESDERLQTQDVPAPIFPYASEIRLQLGFALCQTGQQKNSWFCITPYPTTEWTHSGIVTANRCGKASALAEPGALTLFVRPLHLWEQLSQ